MKKMLYLLRFTPVCFILCFAAGELFAQNQDSVQLLRAGGGAGRSLNGRIQEISPTGVRIQTNQETREIHPSEINRVTFAGQPVEMDRARNLINNGRFEDAMEELQKISSDVSRQEIQQEIAFQLARCAAEISLRGGSIPSPDAGRKMGEFVRNFPQSYHFYTATEYLARLLWAVGRYDLAEMEFEKLQASQWPEKILRGIFYQAQTQIQQNKPEEAIATLGRILQDPNTDDLTQQFKLLARVRTAHAEAMQGKVEQGIRSIEEIIKVEDADNAQLFAHAYNSLGSIYLLNNRYNDAMIAFLHTELLFQGESDLHAEALYHLAQIWPKLDYNDRANRARMILKDQYRNSFWASQL